jgi:hypothetical protein
MMASKKKGFCTTASPKTLKGEGRGRCGHLGASLEET